MSTLCGAASNCIRRLLWAASSAGLDEADALAASTDPEFLARVAAAREEGIERMVTGVPTLYFGEMPVVGCQHYETFEKVAKLAGLVPRA